MKERETQIWKPVKTEQQAKCSTAIKQSRHHTIPHHTTPHRTGPFKTARPLGQAGGQSDRDRKRGSRGRFRNGGFFAATPAVSAVVQASALS